jgi:hypothetical protein
VIPSGWEVTPTTRLPLSALQIYLIKGISPKGHITGVSGVGPLLWLFILLQHNFKSALNYYFNNNLLVRLRDNATQRIINAPLNQRQLLIHVLGTSSEAPILSG